MNAIPENGKRAIEAADVPNDVDETIEPVESDVAVFRGATEPIEDTEVAVFRGATEPTDSPDADDSDDAEWAES